MQGLSEITPAAYAHFTHMLKQLADGKLVLLVEVRGLLATLYLELTIFCKFCGIYLFVTCLLFAKKRSFPSPANDT